MVEMFVCFLPGFDYECMSMICKTDFEQYSITENEFKNFLQKSIEEKPTSSLVASDHIVSNWLEPALFNFN